MMEEPKVTAAQARREDPMCRGVVASWDGFAPELSGYNMTVRDVCQALKCTRSFFDRSVRHLLPYIYNAARARDDDLAAFGLPKLNYREEDFTDMLDRFSTVEQRSKPVEFELVLAPEERLAWRRWRLHVDKQAADARNSFIKEAAVAAAKIESAPGRAARLICAQRGLRVLSATKRSEAEWTPLAGEARGDAIGAVARGDGDTVSSLADWGDPDELWHRRLFAEGRARVTVELPKADGTIARRVLYVHDPRPVPKLPGDHFRDESVVLVDPAEWERSGAAASMRADRAWAKSAGGVKRSERLGTAGLCEALGIPEEEMLRAVAPLEI